MTRARIELAATLFLVLASLVYLAQKSVFSGDAIIDFQFIWLAGEMWAEGADPYTADYAVRGEAMFGGGIGNVPVTWFYPPSWWPVSMAVAQWDFGTATVIWRGASALMLIIGAAIVVLSWRRHVGALTPLRIGLFAAFAALGSAAPIGLALGQTPFVSFLGLSIFIAAYLARSRASMVLALFLLMLKPQIGLPFCGLLIVSRFWWPSLIAGGLVSLAAAAPALGIAGIADFLSAYLAQVGVHATLDPNRPFEMTGLRNLGYAAFGLALSPLLLSLAGAALAAGLRLVCRADDAAGRARLLAAFLATVGLFVALHNYDMILMAPLVVLMAVHPWPLQALGALGLLLIFRANNLAAVTGIYDPDTIVGRGSLLISVGIVLAFAAALLGLVAGRHRVAADAV